MSEMNENLINAEISEEQLEDVSGGIGGVSPVACRTISPTRPIEITANDVNCRYTPNGTIAKTYNKGHRLWVNGITTDEKWYRLIINDPRGGTCEAYIFKKYCRDL